MDYQLVNPHTAVEGPTLPPSSHFTLSSPPGTDIWRKPPSTNTFNAPFLYRSIKLSTFRRARVTVSANWKTLYDQGGLCLALPQSPGSTYRKWIKTGIEFYKGAPQLSTVACDRWADWSLSPLPASGEKSVTVEMEREVIEGEKGSTLLIYMMEGVERKPIREVTWVFGEDEEMEGECWVGAFVAKPTKDADDEEKALSVDFGNLSVESF